MEKLDLTSDEQRRAEQWILHDAELIRGGATVHRLGHLVVTEAQRERMLSGEPGEEEIQEWLDSDVLRAFEAMDETSKMHTRTANALYRDGATTFRQVLMRGTYGVRGVGGKSREMLAAMLQNDLGFELKDVPTPADVAQYCRDLSEVDARIAHGRIKPHISIETFLSAQSPEDALPMMEFLTEHSHETRLHIASNARIRALRFVNAFDEAKREL